MQEPINFSLFLFQGNFSYFWVKKDYSLFRLLRMMFRLNFLVFVVMAVTNNEFVRYYVCAMHTYWFLTVYVMMAVLKSYNEVSTHAKDRHATRAWVMALIRASSWQHETGGKSSTNLLYLSGDASEIITRRSRARLLLKALQNFFPSIRVTGEKEKKSFRNTPFPVTVQWWSTGFHFLSAFSIVKCYFLQRCNAMKF